MTLRTDETQARYDQDRAAGKLVPLKDIPSIRDFAYWRLIHNEYPHDKETDLHHMLVPMRVFPEMMDMNMNEWTELVELMTEILNDKYDSFKVNTDKQRTIPDHFHVHCLNYLRD